MKARIGLVAGIAAAAFAIGAAAPALATSAPPAGNPNEMIVGGSPATEQYDWMASLQRQGSHTCGSTVIDKQWVLTAAHCVQEVQAPDLKLRIGSPNHTEGGTEAAVSEIVVHPDYATKQPHADVALLRLAEPVDVTPAPLADAPTEAGTPTRIIGWGLTCPVRGCGEPPVELQQLETHAVADEQCSTGQIDAGSEICTGSQKPLANACFGDSGGPQLQGTPGNWRVVGVASRLGSPVPACGTAPSIYTDVAAHNAWIKGVIGK